MLNPADHMLEYQQIAIRGHGSRSVHEELVQVSRVWGKYHLW
jgi:hypothetical protein